QLSGEVFERIPQMRNRVAEANQVAGHAAVIIELPTAGSIGLLGGLQLLLQFGDPRALLVTGRLETILFLLQLARRFLPSKQHRGFLALSAQGEAVIDDPILTVDATRSLRQLKQ